MQLSRMLSIVLSSHYVRVRVECTCGVAGDSGAVAGEYETSFSVILYCVQ